MSDINISRRTVSSLLLGAASTSLVGCAARPTIHQGLVEDPESGILVGSTVSNSLITDPTFYRNNVIKIRTRNTSGDPAFDLNGFQVALQHAFAAKGYEPHTEGNFGLLLDYNILFSGHIQSNMSSQYTFLGGAAGAVAGLGSSSETGAYSGLAAGASLGAIIGQYRTEDTYIIIGSAAIAITTANRKGRRKTVTFGGEKKRDKYEEEIDQGIDSIHRIEIATYAGGANVSQREIVDIARERMVRILKDLI